MASPPASPDAGAALAAHTRESLAALDHAALLDAATALASHCRSLRSSLAASASIYMLPDELLSRALHALPLVSRVRASAVSRRFRRMLSTEALRAAVDPAHVLLSSRSLTPGQGISSPNERLVLTYQFFPIRPSGAHRATASARWAPSPLRAAP